MDTPELVALPLVLAMEPVTGHVVSRTRLTRDEARELVQLVANDLHEVVPETKEAQLVLGGAMFDQVELLRPGFPVWHALEELAGLVPNGRHAKAIAFGAHEERMPAAALEPSDVYAAGPMRLLPLLLLAPAGLAEAMSEALERELVGRGATGMHTADWIMRVLDLKLEHARYFSRNDMMAMASVQYEHVNLSPMWTLLEAALLSPDREESAMSTRGLMLRWADGLIRAESPATWLAGLRGGLGEDAGAQRAHDFAGIVFELRQYATVLEAHGVGLTLDVDGATAADGFVLETLAEPVAGREPPVLYAHEARGLGVITVTVAEHGAGGEPHLLAHGYPLTPQALGPLLALLADRYHIEADLHALGRVLLDEAGHLTAPALALH